MVEIQKVVIQIEADTSKATASVNSFQKAIEEGITDALKESGASAKQVEEALKKLGTSGTTGLKSLKTQIREAKEEAQKLSQQFGDNSKQALSAQKNVAKLTEELSDFNQRVKALNPEAKFNAVTNSLQGVLGGIQGVTGALQIFGGESEEVTKIAQKLQGAINLAQGINSIVGLKDAFSNLRVVLGITTVAQQSLAVATTEEAGATVAATAATEGFALALTATGIGAIVVALGALVAAYYAVEKSTQAAKDETERFKKKLEDLDAASETFGRTFNKILDERLEKLDFEVKKAQARGDSEKEIIRLQMERYKAEIAASDAAIKTGKATIEQENEIIKNRKKAAQELELLQLRLTKIIVDENSKRIKSDADYIKKAKDGQVELTKTTEDEVKKRGEAQVGSQQAYGKKSNLGFKETQELIFKGTQESIDFFDSIIQSSFERQQQSLQSALDSGIISQEKFNEETKRLQRKAAAEEKQFALFRALINTAVAVTNALQTPPFSPVLAAFAAAQGALQIAAIAAKPLPKFAKGQLPERSQHYSEKDDRLAWVGGSETIFSAKKTRAYYPTMEAIYKGHISPYQINSFVRASGKKDQKQGFDTSGLVHAISRNKKVHLENVDIIARKIGEQINSSYSRRRLI